METMKFLAYLLALYGMYGIYKGEIYCKDGIKMRYVYKQQQPFTFWVVCSSYIFMGLFIVFASSKN